MVAYKPTYWSPKHSIRNFILSLNPTVAKWSILQVDRNLLREIIVADHPAQVAFIIIIN